MLFVALLFLTIGTALIYAGLHSGDTWKHPWSPFTDYLKTA